MLAGVRPLRKRLREPAAAAAATGRGAQRGASGLQVIGWREWLGLPELGIALIKAKIDSGARSSCLHALDISEFRQHGIDYVRFTIERRRGTWAEYQAPVVDRREVRDSGGHRSLRPFIRTELDLGGECWPIELNLAPRGDMLFSMLLGRTAMVGRFLVDPARSYLLGAGDA